jgi:hypothetical protein
MEIVKFIRAHHALLILFVKHVAISAQGLSLLSLGVAPINNKVSK